MVKVTPLFKGGDRLLARTCRLKPVLPTLSKILKRIMYNGILTENKVLVLEYFGLEDNTSTEHFKVSWRYY